MYFFITDPHFFICPTDSGAQPTAKMALRFLNRLNSWAELFREDEYRVGISDDCLALLKSHPYSLFNSLFRIQLSLLLTTQFTSVLNKVLGVFEEKMPEFSRALDLIDPNKLLFELKQTTYTPVEFGQRLPLDFHQPFADMLGHLTFGQAQHVFPITAFQNVQFLSAWSDLEELTWRQYDMRLYTAAHVEYFLDEGMDNVESIANPVQGEFELVQTASTVPDITPIRTVHTLGDVLEKVCARYSNRLFISRELEDQLKQPKSYSNADQILRAIEGLVLVLLDAYNRPHLPDTPYKSPSTIYQEQRSHEIGDESGSVHQDERLRSYRRIHFDDQELYAYLHVKTTPRIHFAVTQFNGQNVIVLGPIVRHLPTADYDLAM